MTNTHSTTSASPQRHVKRIYIIPRNHRSYLFPCNTFFVSFNIMLNCSQCNTPVPLDSNSNANAMAWWMWSSFTAIWALRVLAQFSASAACCCNRDISNLALSYVSRVLYALPCVSDPDASTLHSPLELAAVPVAMGPPAWASLQSPWQQPPSMDEDPQGAQVSGLP